MADYNSSWGTPEGFEADIRKGVAAKGEVDNLKAVARTGSYNDLTDKPTKASFGLGNVDNTSDLNKPISTATQTALNGKVDKVSGKGLSTNDYTTAEKQKLAGLSNYDDSAIKAEIGAIVNNGTKNLLKLNNIGTSTVSGRTYQLNDNGTITCSGEATGNAIKYIFGTGSTTIPAMIPIPVGKYILSGGAKNSTTVSIYIRNTEDSSRYLYYHVEDIERAIEIIENDVICVGVRTSNGISNTVVVEPMLRDASIEDDTFVPYAPSNRELYEMILALTQND